MSSIQPSISSDHQYRTSNTAPLQSPSSPIQIVLNGKPASLKILLPHDTQSTPSLAVRQAMQQKVAIVVPIIKLIMTNVMIYQMTGAFGQDFVPALNTLKNSTEFPEGKLLVDQALALVTELCKKNYGPVDVTTHMNWFIRLISTDLAGKATTLEKKVKDLTAIILNPQTQFIDRSKESNNPSFKIVLQDETMALLKLPKKEFFSSFGRDVSVIRPFAAPVWQNEMMAFEQDDVLGFDLVPELVAVEVEQDGQVQRGIIQRYLPNTKPANQLCYEKNGVQLLKSIPTITAHRLAIGGLFYGFGAGHGANYVMQERNGEITNGYIIDGKETFIPINRLTSASQLTHVQSLPEKLEALKSEIASPSSKTSLREKLDAVKSQIEKILEANKNAQENTLIFYAKSYSEKLEAFKQSIEGEISDLNSLSTQITTIESHISTIFKATVVMRIYILGFQQNKAPLDRATLLTLSNPLLLSNLMQYQERVKGYYQVTDETFQAQLERVRMIQDLCKHELEKETPQLTPRDLFFHICGGEELYKIGKAKGYPDLMIFAHLISDPYQFAQKDFSNLDSIPVCSRMVRPLDGTEAMKIYFDNLCDIEGVKKSDPYEIKQNSESTTN